MRGSRSAGRKFGMRDGTPPDSTRSTYLALGLIFSERTWSVAVQIGLLSMRIFDFGRSSLFRVFVFAYVSGVSTGILPLVVAVAVALSLFFTGGFCTFRRAGRPGFYFRLVCKNFRRSQELARVTTCKGNYYSTGFPKADPWIVQT